MEMKISEKQIQSLIQRSTKRDNRQLQGFNYEEYAIEAWNKRA